MNKIRRKTSHFFFLGKISNFLEHFSEKRVQDNHDSERCRILRIAKKVATVIEKTP